MNKMMLRKTTGTRKNTVRVLTGVLAAVALMAGAGRAMAQGSSKIGPAAPVTKVPAGAILVRVSSAGFDPSLIPVKAGRSVKLAFFRFDAQNCGREVVFPTLGIRRELPVGQTVMINVTPRKTGSLTFSCGMNMLHGELLVRSN